MLQRVVRLAALLASFLRACRRIHLIGSDAGRTLAPGANLFTILRSGLRRREVAAHDQ